MFKLLLYLKGGRKLLLKSIFFTSVFFFLFIIFMLYTGRLFTAKKSNGRDIVFLTSEPVALYYTDLFKFNRMWFTARNTIVNPFFKKARLYRITYAVGSPPRSFILASNILHWATILNTRLTFSDWGKVNTCLWNKIAKNENIHISNAAEALEYSKFVIKASYKFPGLGAPFQDSYYLVFLNNIKNIKGYNPKNKTYINIKPLVSPPKIWESMHLYTIELFTWHRIGGILDRWDIQFTQKGEIKGLNQNMLKSNIGDCLFVL
jgi:hypothetical protein